MGIVRTCLPRRNHPLLGQYHKTSMPGPYAGDSLLAFSSALGTNHLPVYGSSLGVESKNLKYKNGHAPHMRL